MSVTSVNSNSNSVGHYKDATSSTKVEEPFSIGYKKNLIKRFKRSSYIGKYSGYDKRNRRGGIAAHSLRFLLSEES